MRRGQATSVLLISGSVGVGKSTVADEVYETLKSNSIPIALINLDELGYANVESNDEFNVALRFKNLAAVWDNYSSAGITHVVIPWVVDSAEVVARFEEAIPNSDIHLVLLSASPDKLRQRIISRPMGGSLEWHLKRAEELSELLADTHLEDSIVDTSTISATEVADIVIADWQKTWNSPENR